ncbi:MAG: hypothetical protein PHS05_12255 [Bacteroidales bacterium]|mgnify:CR=1 FL=1|jgi:hypothetical protein|nr:hypothetical protein [Bacteroidales bacterium]
MKEDTYINIGKSLHVFNEIELFISLIIVHYIEPKDKKFFLDYILNPAVVSFGAKIKILINLDIFNNNQIKKIRDLSTNRNVFAHSNRTESAEIEEVDSRHINLLISDVIFKTKSDGRLVKMSYPSFAKEHVQLQNEVIDFISDYIIKHQIDTQYNHISNLLLFKK